MVNLIISVANGICKRNSLEKEMSILADSQDISIYHGWAQIRMTVAEREGEEDEAEGEESK